MMLPHEPKQARCSRASWALLALCCLAACGTTSNRKIGGSAPPVPSRAPVSSASEESGNPGDSTGAPASDASVPGNTPGNAPGAAASAAPRAAVTTSSGAEGDATIATVAGHEIHASELLELWLFRESPKVRAYLEEMVLSNLVLAEAHRLEMSLDVAMLDRSVERSLEGLREQIQKTAPELDVEGFVRQRLGLDPAMYRARLRRETEIDLLAERCVRSWLLQSDRAEVRVIVVDDRESADLVQQKLDEGRKFAELAEELSVEESASDGGRVPPIVRSDAALSRLAFTTPVGDVGGPVLEQGRYLFLKVEERKPPIPGEWSKLRGPVELSLERRAIEDPEYWQWKMAMLDRYTVDMTPFLRLVGEPTGAPGDPAPGAAQPGPGDAEVP